MAGSLLLDTDGVFTDRLTVFVVTVGVCWIILADCERGEGMVSTLPPLAVDALVCALVGLSFLIMVVLLNEAICLALSALPLLPAD